MIQNVIDAGAEVANGFFQTYYLSLLQDIFYVLTDSDHKSGASLCSSVNRHETRADSSRSQALRTRPLCSQGCSSWSRRT